jgi:hypothetical protein
MLVLDELDHLPVRDRSALWHPGCLALAVGLTLIGKADATELVVKSQGVV